MLSERESAIVQRVLAPYAAQIERAAVFGSRAMGTARPASDIDLVLYGTLSEGQVARLWTMFDESPLAVTVDLVAYNLDIHPPLRRHIDSVARTLFERQDLIG